MGFYKVSLLQSVPKRVGHYTVHCALVRENCRQPSLLPAKHISLIVNFFKRVVLPKTSCQKSPAKYVLTMMFCQMCPYKGILPKMSCLRYPANGVFQMASCQMCPAKDVLPKVSWKGVLSKMSFHRYPANDALPKVSCQRRHTKTTYQRRPARGVLLKASCQWCPDRGSW